MRFLYALSCFYLLSLKAASAQTATTISRDSLSQLRKSVNKKFVEIYKENTELSYLSPLGDFGAPSKYIITGRVVTNYVLATKYLPISFMVVPDFTVRVRDERSAGVRTPSFRISGTLLARLNTDLNRYRYATLGFNHHSNGQDEEAINPDGSLNTRTGNFDTNYLLAAYHFGNRVPHGIKEAYYTFNHDVGLEWHKWFAYEKALADNYGFTRVIYNFSLRNYQQEKENWRLNAGLNYAINSIVGYEFWALKKRLNTEASFHYSFPFMNNMFFMVATGYYGEDPYNIYYRDKYGYVRFGISSGFLRNRRQYR